MKILILVVLVVGFLSVPFACAQATGSPKPALSAPPPNSHHCAACTVDTKSSHDSGEAVAKPIPGTNETMVVGRVENLIPIGVLTVLGCEKCSAEAVNWALQQGSSFDDVERTLRTVSFPDGGGQHTNYGGTALPLVVTKTVTATPNPSIISSTTLDGLGRTVKTSLVSDPEGQTDRR